MTYQNVWKSAKTLSRNFISINVYMRNKEISKSMTSASNLRLVTEEQNIYVYSNQKKIYMQ